MNSGGSISLNDSASSSSRHDVSPIGGASAAQDHPLTLELTSLRTSLARFQSLAHTASMRLQGKTMECTLAAESERRAKERCRLLEAEVEVLRTRDAGIAEAGAMAVANGERDHKQSASSSTHGSGALAELTLAHRRLSAKFDALDEHYALVVERFAAAESDHDRRRIEAENLGVLVLDWKDKVLRIQEELKRERTRSERLTSALRAGGVSIPAEDVALPSDDLEKDCARSSQHECPTCASASTSSLQLSLEHSESLRTAAEEQGRDERAARLAAERQLALLRADDTSASRTVERYMAFTQKTAERLYASLHDQAARQGATIKTLRAELALERGALAKEKLKTEQLRAAVDELAESLERETFGRRREIALRMRQVAREESRADEAARWIDRVRRERNRMPETSSSHNGGAYHHRPEISTLSLSLSASSSPLPTPGGNLTLSPYSSPIKVKPTANGSLSLNGGETTFDSNGGDGLRRSAGSSNSLASLDTPNAAIMGVSPYSQHVSMSTSTTLLWDLLESGVELLARYDEEPEIPLPRRKKAAANGANDHADATETAPIDGNLGRVLLAQELAAGLLVDLERETKQRVKLAKERARLLMIDDEDDKPDTEKPAGELAEKEEEEESAVPRPPPIDTDKTPRMTDVESFDGPRPSSGLLQAVNDSLDDATPQGEVNGGYSTLQRSLHSCATSILRLRALAKADLSAEPRPAQWDTALDALDDVLEDVRVEVEIAAADDARVKEAEGTMRKLAAAHSDRQASEDKDKDEARRNLRQSTFERKLGDIEHDLVVLKMALHHTQTAVPSGGDDSDLGMNPSIDPLGSLRTVRLPTARSTGNSGGPKPSPPLTNPTTGSTGGNGLRRGFLPALGRTFSGTTPSASLLASSSNEAAVSSMPTLPRYASWSSDLTFETAMMDEEEQD